MAWDAREFSKQLAGSVKSFDTEGAGELCHRLITYLRHTDDIYPIQEAKKVLGHLRRKRYFDLMQRAADAFIQSGQTAPQIRRQYAQSLLDQSNFSAAIHYLKLLVDDTANDAGENAEARGLLGRAYKQLYMDAGDSSTRRAQDALNEGIRWYREVFESDPKLYWHGINTSALLCRAARDGVAVDGISKPAEVGRKIAQRVRKEIEDLWDEGKASMWDSATAAEACVALDKSAEAVEWTGRYVREPQADAFELGSTHRQFVEVWQLDMGSDPGASLLPILRSELLQREGSRLEVSPQDLQPGPLDQMSDKHLEKVLGTVRYVSLKFMQQALERGRAVARVEHGVDQGFGTGFLVKGGDLLPSLGNELLLLTNAHVVTDDPSVPALRPDQAIVTFQILKEGGAARDEYNVQDLLWTSPPSELDASLLRLGESVSGILPYPVATRLPLADEDQRVYVIGHPKGGGLSFSIQDNVLLDHDPPKIHYRAPTEGGSSGSPVFNQQWRLIGLHHAGSKEMPRLHGELGTYAANEGIWIQSIKEAMAKQPPA